MPYTQNVVLIVRQARALSEMSRRPLVGGATAKINHLVDISRHFA
jgi:hypothetical protein